MSAGRYVVDRLWPDPSAGLDLDDAMSGFRLPDPPAHRPLIGLNMITSIDGRAQLASTAEGLGGRADRRLLQLYRAAYDAVGSGAGTLRAAGLWLRVVADLVEHRAAQGRPPQPTGVLIAGTEPVVTDARWFSGDEPRLLIVGAGNPQPDPPPGTELVRAPTARPRPQWIVELLAERGIRSFLLEGGPHLNAAFLAEGLLDELYWTVGAHLLGTDALPMVAPIPGGSPYASEPWRGTLVSAHRHESELFLRYRFGGGAGGAGGEAGGGDIGP